MEPITLATSFGTIVGLLSDFKASRDAAKGEEYQEFMKWLAEKNHDEVAAKLNDNAQLGNAIKRLLSRNHDEVMSRLADLDQSVQIMASRMPFFRDISLSIDPGNELSDQAIKILRCIYQSGAKGITIHNGLNETNYVFLDGHSDKGLPVQEERFVDDDFATLCSLGLLRHSLTKNGHDKYLITRQAANYLESVGSNS